MDQTATRKQTPSPPRRAAPFAAYVRAASSLQFSATPLRSLVMQHHSIVIFLLHFAATVTDASTATVYFYFYVGICCMIAVLDCEALN